MMKFPSTITVFGNEIMDGDNVAVRLVPELRRQFPQINFQIADPTENVAIPHDLWVILDVGIGLDKVVVVTDLKQLEYVKGQSVHDYDVYLDLRLREKIGTLPPMYIVLVPASWIPQQALKKIIPLLSQLSV